MGKKSMSPSVDSGAVGSLSVPMWRRFKVIFSKLAHQTGRC